MYPWPSLNIAFRQMTHDNIDEVDIDDNNDDTHALEKGFTECK